MIRIRFCYVVANLEFLGGLLGFFGFFHCVALWVLVALSGDSWGLGEGDEEGAVVGVGRVRKMG